MKKIGKYLILILTTIFIFGLSINVYANPTDMSGNDGGRGDETASNGFSVGSNVGWRIYVLDENGNAKSEVVDSLYYSPSADIIDYETRHGEMSSKQVTGCEIPKALYAGNDADGAECWYSNYGEVKGWLDADQGDGTTNASHVIKVNFGDDIAQAFIDGSETLYFCIEPIYCMGIFNGPDSSSCIGRAYGTPNNWANLMISLGIYYITNNVTFPTQVVVTSQLSKQAHSSLRVLSANAEREDVEHFLNESTVIKTQQGRNDINAVLNASARANMEVYEDIRRSSGMSCEALRELFKDELEEAYSDGKRQGEAESKELERLGEKRGKDAAQREIIFNMHKKGCTVEQISDLINISKEDIEKIVNSELRA